MEKVEDELAGLRQFLATLEAPETFYRKNGEDIKSRAIEILKRELAHLEAALARRDA